MTTPIALADIAPGDLVLVSKPRARVQTRPDLHARVLGAGVGGLTIAPLQRLSATATPQWGEIDHWRHTDRPQPVAGAGGCCSRRPTSSSTSTRSA